MALDSTFAALLKVLPDDCQIDFRRMVNELSDINDSISKSDWTTMVGLMKQILKLFDITTFQDVKEFGKWMDKENIEVQDDENVEKVLQNRYIYTDEETQRIVDMEFGSIHSVKGRTHLATLVLETFLQTHNIKAILKHLCSVTPPKSVGKNQKRLKCQYVAMTRARALLCLAIPIDFVDDKTQEKLQGIGWKIKTIN